MSYEKIETMKVIFQTNQEKSMRLKYIGDACTSYVKTIADIENAYSSLALQLMPHEIKPFREELDKNALLALNNVRDAIKYANELAKEKDLEPIFGESLANDAALKAYAFGLFLAYYQTTKH